MTVKPSPTSPSSESSISRELSTAESVAPAYRTMEEFLKAIEKRAFAIAKISTSRHEDALDIVQETMFKMVEKYGSKPVPEWRPLFYRILNNKITDHYRRQAVRNNIFIWKSSDNDQSDDCFQSDIASSVERRSEAKGVQKLARRQREAFLLRSWECLSTRETAYAMGCTEGSVKTHYSRALEKLREQLAGYDYD
jgi:RNA polymerase sigma-70 factor (ECF subfamily)